MTVLSPAKNVLIFRSSVSQYWKKLSSKRPKYVWIESTSDTVNQQHRFTIISTEKQNQFAESKCDGCKGKAKLPVST